MNSAKRGPGPADPVAARPGTGFASRLPYVVQVPQGTGVRRVALDGETGLEGRVLQPGTELRWIVHPEGEGALDTLWDATHVAVDLGFDDGTWLSEACVTDQYGCPVDAASQGAARRLWVDQWNLRRVDLSPVAGRRVRQVAVVVEASRSRRLRVHVDDVGIALVPPRHGPGLHSVDTTRGTHSSGRFSRGNTAPLVGLPHGGVFGLPMTDASSDSWPYAYHAHHVDTPDGGHGPALQAFATSHLPSPWMGDRGVLQVMPSPSRTPDCSRTGRALTFDRATERAGPHRYAVTFDCGVAAELTAGTFAVGLRCRLPGAAGAIVLDHLGKVSEVSLRRDGDEGVVELVLHDRPGMPPHAAHLRVTGVVADHLVVSDGRLRGHLEVEASSGHVDVLVGLSTIDVRQAARNLADAGSFDAMRTRAERDWTERLATLVPVGGSADQDIAISSGLYRTFLYPNEFGERAGRDEPAYRSPYDLDSVAAGPLSTTHGFWDTYRTVWPLLALLTPEAAGGLADGFVRHAELCGWTPRWSAPGAEDCMTGTTLDVVLADLVVRGVPGFDPGRAYDTALRNATAPSEDARVGRKGLRPGIFRGWIATDTPEGLSWTLDNAINDWGAALLSRAARPRRSADGRSPDHDWDAEWEYLARRSLGYRNVFDRDRGFFIGREPDGDWRDPFNPDVWGHDYTETNAWGTAFTAPHDGRGLAELHGGETALGRHLDTFFGRPETGHASLSGHYGSTIHEMTEARDIRMGMLGLSNQPAHHIPFMYMFAGRHDDAHRIVRECLDRLFVGSDLGQGYPGDEDNGEMSAWYVFASIGLYPLAPGSGEYVLVPPSLRRTEIRPLGAPLSTIDVVDGDAGMPYVRAVRVDGEAWDRISLPHERLLRGCRIEFELAATPSGWAQDSRPASASDVHGFTDLADDTTDCHAHALVDDAAETVVSLACGESVTLPLRRPVPLSLVTLTADEPGVRSWRIDLIDEAGAVAAGRTYADQRFRWPGQTRAFTVPRSPGAGHITAVQLTALSATTLRQVEAIAVDGCAERS